MADSNITDEQEAHSRLVLYQVSLGLALVAINHRAISRELERRTRAIYKCLQFYRAFY